GAAAEGRVRGTGMHRERIGYIGIGIMGRGMARNLLKAGFPVTVHNRTRAKAEALVPDGAVVAGSPAEVAARSDVVITNLPDTPDVEAVLTGPGGVLETLRPGSVVIDHSTISPAATRRLAALVEAKGSHYLDAPVTGGEAGAAAGTLTIMVGGSPAAFERVRPVLEAEGKTIVHVSPQPGSGQMVKLINNLVVAAFLGALAEGFAFARKAGLDPGAVATVLGSGAARSAIGELKVPKILAGDFRPSFYLRLHHKDLDLALEVARELDVALPVGAAAAQLFTAGVAMGLGELDNAAVARVVAALNGLEPAGPRGTA
ncbi:MAG TPA: NAD(P)-dependent oxidoreductase, partial [Thermodesulfobacteriota bacterium]|nr:NAD(P)-dependent oxidoreductase [Thermodesulfobacteriota bacterium]